MSNRKENLVLILLIFNVIQMIDCDITVSKDDLLIQINHNATFQLLVKDYQGDPFDVEFDIKNTRIARVVPSSVRIDKSNESIEITVKGLSGGESRVSAKVPDSTNLDAEDVFVRVRVYRVNGLDLFSDIIGWIYFVSWSFNMYPQIYTNFKRKSVVGLNFDYLAINLVGFSLYSVFNLGLYLIPEIKDEYFARYPDGLNPVRINDVVFSLHTTAATIFIIGQCMIFERGDQKMSYTGKGVLAIFALFLFISIILAGTGVIQWLDYLYYCSYVKLATTMIKYIPQIYMHFKTKTTVGWNIGYVYMDITGGLLSMLQMIINAYNYDDWVSIFGDPSKFGLGLFSVLFDIVFFIQHYILYRHNNAKEKSMKESWMSFKKTISCSS